LPIAPPFIIGRVPGLIDRRAPEKSTVTPSLPPGPSAPAIVQALRYGFDLHRLFAASRARYGDTWTLRLPGFPPSVITSDRDAIRRLFTGDPLVKRHANDLLAPLLGSNSLLLLEPAEHLARRRLELPPFHGDRIRSYTERVRELVEQEVASWAPGRAVDTHPRAQAFTLSVILELVLGVRDQGLQRSLSEIFDAMNRPRHNLGLFLPPAITRRSRWNLASRPFWSMIDRLHRLLLAQIAATRTDPRLSERHDVLALLVQARDADGEALTDAELRDELVTLVAAGHDTTASAIGWGVELLAHHPDVVRRLREAAADGDRTYAGATAKEVLRLRTILPVSAARRVLEPFEIGGHVVGPEAAILVDAETLHHDPALYPAPSAFRPQRFLEGTPERYTYLPFGGGAHRCLGSALATVELEQALEVVALRRELKPVGAPARPARRGVTFAPGRRGRVRILGAATASAMDRSGPMS
jgi:cytochrome P450